ncbi:MAG: alpha/beta fold hydrolase [Oscillospiraceae bacterium]|nr:alpha/beta fold hydrolase [Oscillospiraceae bacterium]
MNILQMSISTGLIAVAIVIVRAVALNKLPKTMFLVLWGVVVLRLLIPVSVSIPSKFGVYDIAGEIAQMVVPDNTAANTQNINDIIIPTENISAPAAADTNGISNDSIDSTEQITPIAEKQTFNVSDICNTRNAIIVWIIGMIAMFGYFAVVYFKNYRELRFSLPVVQNKFTDKLPYVKNIKILQSDKLTSPVTAGIIKPRIILPKSMNMNDKQLLQYVLTHEYYHIRRFDGVWKLLLIAVLCIHWFNPMAWVMFILASRDLEITCDEMVIRHLGAETKKSYAFSIISIAEQRAKFAPLYSGFSKNAAEERIKSIMKYKKSSILAIILSVVLAAGLTGALAACTQKAGNNTNNAVAENNSNPQIMQIKSFDGYMLKGKLTLPDGNDKISKLVIFVNGSGPNTYDDHRNIGSIEYNYFDFWAEQFSTNGVAFFSYNTRGVDMGTEPPLYANVNDQDYKSYLPLNEVEDISYMIKAIKENDRLKDCKVLLLGWSDGTIIAPLVAQKYPDMVNALFLCGYANDNLKDILMWQQDGGASMVWYRQNFDTNGDGKVSKAEYGADPNNVVTSVLKNASFGSIDVNNDGYIDESDLSIILKDSREAIFNAIDKKDNEWLKKYYPVQLTSGWFLQHFGLKSNMDLLPSLNLPIYIFHGTLDQSCDVNGVYAIRDKFAELNKNNLTVNVFEGYNHDLNYTDIILKDEIPAGIQTLIDTVVKF